MEAYHRWTALEALDALHGRQITCEDLVQSCLDRMKEREPEVRAWAHVDAEGALAEARARDREGAPRGPLHGLPIGVKDVIDTHDMPTEYGSSIYERHRPRWDAACVALAREAGAIILGKTVTTEFATRHPGKSRNPVNLAHTPGGSSSGSAAAVADAMVPFAFGTQTTGSLIRPSSFCGIVGYKPSYGLLNRAGLKPLSESQDTIGVHARTVPDAALLVGAISGANMPAFGDAALASPRIGFCRTYQWDCADEHTHAALESAASQLARSGAQVAELQLPAAFEDAARAQDVINEFETWRALCYERTNHHDLLSPALTERLARAGTRSRQDYEQALALAGECRSLMGSLFAEFDVLLAPSAPGEAPEGLGYTGDPVFSQVWTLMHAPCVTVPALQGPKGLPLGVQIVGPRGTDGRVLLAAEWVFRALVR